MPEPGDDPGMVTVTDPRTAGNARPLLLYRQADQAYIDERAALSRARTWEAQGETSAAEMRRRDAQRVRGARESLRREAAAEKLIPPPADIEPAVAGR